MDLQVVSVLATLLIIVDGDCDVYSNQQTRIIERCAQIQDCVSKALLNNRNNLYILDRVFRSTQTRPPTSLIVNYTVTRITNDCNITRDQDGASTASGSGIDAGVVTDTQQLNPTNDTDDCHGASNNYTEASDIDSIGVTQIKLGWSSTGIYKAIRPDVLIALQPASYWIILSLAIDNYGLPRTVHLSLNITNTTECELLEDITRVEMKEALEHLTEKLNHEIPGKVWNVNTDSLQQYETGLIAVMTSLAFIIIMLLIAILPTLSTSSHTMKFIGNDFPVIITVFILVIHPGEFLLNRAINTDNLRVIHDIILTVMPMALGILISIIGILTSLSSLYTKKRAYYFFLYYIFIFWPALILAISLLPILIEAFIYPTEVISFISFIVICYAGTSAAYTTINWFIRNGTCICTSVHKNNRNLRFTHDGIACITKGIIILYIHMAMVPCLIFYLSLLRHRLESPTSQLIQTLLAFIPPILAGFGSYFLSKMLAAGSKDKSEATDETESDDNTNTPTNQTTDSDSATEDQQSDTNSSNNQTDPPQGDPPTDDQQHDGGEQQLQSVAFDTQRQESPQESEEIQVIVEVHPTNNSDVIQESIV